MRNYILIFVFLFALTGSYANNFSNDELKSSSVELVSSFEESVDDIYNFDDFDFKSLSIEVNTDGSCTISASGSVAGFSVSITVTAGTCREALAELRDTINAVREMFE